MFELVQFVKSPKERGTKVIWSYSKLMVLLKLNKNKDTKWTDLISAQTSVVSRHDLQSRRGGTGVWPSCCLSVRHRLHLGNKAKQMCRLYFFAPQIKECIEVTGWEFTLLSIVCEHVWWAESCLLSALRCVARLQTERVHCLVQTGLTVSQYCVSGGKADMRTWGHEDTRGACGLIPGT